MIRVLQVISGWGSGGVEKYISNCASILCGSVVFDILAVRGVAENPLFSESIINSGGHIFSIPKSRYGNYFQRKKCRRKYIENHLKMNKYDIVHINGTTADFMEYAKIAKKIQPNVKVIMHCHGDGVDMSNKYIKQVMHYISKQLYSSSVDCCLGCSSRTMSWMYTKNLLKSRPNKVINCGIDTRQFKFDEIERIKVRQELGINNKFVIGTIGRICELKKQLPQVVFLWIGTGDMKKTIEEEAAKLQLSDNIIFYGTTSNVTSMLSAMDVFILPSNYEGNPIVGFESQANGVKCFFSDKITNESKITDVVDFLSIENSEKLWAKNIILYKDGYKRFNTQDKIIESGYDFKDCVYELKIVYDELIKR